MMSTNELADAVQSMNDEKMDSNEIIFDDMSIAEAEPLITESMTPIEQISAIERFKISSVTEIVNAVKEYNSSSNQLPYSNFLKGCKWSPDGACLLTNSEDNCMRLFNLPERCYSKPETVDLEDELDPVLRMSESDTIYDFCWYPAMHSSNPESCLIATTSQQSPIHFWDAYTGKIVASFRGYNYADEMVAAHCVSFSGDSSKLLAGYENVVRVFDPQVPGRKYTVRKTLVNKKGQRGILSCIACDPSNHNRYAVGSYSKQISIYDHLVNLPIADFEGQRGGVTNLCFSKDGYRLFSGGRKDNDILCWDTRNMSSILAVMTRQVRTHQRVYFDIDSRNDHLASGNHDGRVLVWALDISADADEEELPPVFEYKAHKDCVNGISFHPTLPIIATTSGQRKFRELSNSDDESVENPHFFVAKRAPVDNSLKLWWYDEHSLLIDNATN